MKHYFGGLCASRIFQSSGKCARFANLPLLCFSQRLSAPWRAGGLGEQIRADGGRVGAVAYEVALLHGGLLVDSDLDDLSE